MSDTIKQGCCLCPRNCGVDRSSGKTGYCGETTEIMAARAALHMWEEPCISGEAGSGAVFFSGCQLRCVYCQNREIAEGKAGKVITVDRLAEIFIELQKKGANNINLVTPTHYILQIMEALDRSRAMGMNLPVVYNTSSYETVETIQRLKGYVDVFLPDLKYVSSELSSRYSHAADYFNYAKKAIDQMVKQAGPVVIGEDGLIKSGVIVRHLALPGCIEDSKAVIQYLYETYKDDIYISIMSQYTPLAHVSLYPEINRKLSKKEYDELVDYAIDLGVENGFIQEEEAASESFIPQFDYEGI